MKIFSTRDIVRQNINTYYQAVNMLSLGVSYEAVNASVAGSGEALLNVNHGWWRDRAVNELLELTPDGREYFIP